MALATIAHGQVAVTGSAVQITTQLGASAIVVKAHDANAAKVYIGGSTVTTSTGIELGPGQSVALDLVEPRLLYVIGTAGSDKVSYLIHVS